MRKRIILCITSLALCAAASLYSIKAANATDASTQVQKSIYGTQILKEDGTVKSIPLVQKANLLKDASIETSAMAMWEHSSGKTTVSWLFDNKEEKEIVNYLQGIDLGDVVNNLDISKLKGNMYGIEIGRKDGTFAGFTWIDGYVFMENGDVYKADIDFNSIAKYAWQDKNNVSLISFPNMYYIAKNNGKWNKNFLEKSSKLKSKGISIKCLGLEGKKLEVKIKNTTKKELYYGEAFALQVKIDGKWYNIPAEREMAFNDIAHILKAGSGTKKTYDLSAYGELPDGKYRIVTEGAFSVFLAG